MRLLIIVNKSWNFINFRKELIYLLNKKEFKVTLICEDKNKNLEIFRKMGCNLEFVGNNFLLNIIKIKTLLFKIKPEIVLNYTFKSIFCFTLSNLFLQIKSINTFSGLGYLFIKKKYTYAFLLFLIFCFTSSKKSIFLFHNIYDLKFFKRFHFIKKIKLININGSGVNTKNFNTSFFPIKTKKTHFLMVARLLREKGIIEFCKAAKEIAYMNPNIHFTLIVKTSLQNPGLINYKEIEKDILEAKIKYIENQDDVRSYIEKCHCIILPSYREGLSKFLLEGMSMSRPVITTDVPGCNELVKNNGLTCNVKDYLDLKKQIIKFNKLSKSEMKELGINSRRIIIKKYDVDKINNKYLEIINRLKC